MAGRIVYDLVEPAVLVNYVRRFDNEVLRPETAQTLEDMLPNTPIEDLEYRIRKGSLNDVDIAEYRAWDTPPPMTGRQGVTFVRGSLGPVSRQIPMGEEEFLRTRALLTNTDDPIITQIYADAELMTRAVQTRIEVARADLIDDGSVTIAENGLALTANFGRDASMRQTAAILWTLPATAKPLSDLLGWVQAYVDRNGVEPGNILMSKYRLPSLALNQELRDYAASNGTTPSRINENTIANILANEGLPPIRLYDRQYRRNGVRTRMLSQNKVYLTPPAGEALGATFYGITAEALKLASKGYIQRTDMPGIVAVVTETESPVQTYTVGTGVALPAMPNPDLVLDAVVA